jgi:cytoplasmic iron level regulating protein YaaA (DUF328/UPF0246 family)
MSLPCQREDLMLYALLSPAKRLDFKPVDGFKATQPALLKDTAALAARARRLSRDQIGRLMEISPALAQLNFERFQAFDPANRAATKPAIFAFAGDVYMGLEAKTLSKDDIAFAQQHIGILSGLYGLLRPLDSIQPYRLEMGSRLDTDRGDDLYDFWRDRLTEHLNAVAKKIKAKAIVNLASVEYWSAVDEKRLKAPVIHPAFKEIKSGKATIVSFLAKKARGMMARAIVQNRWTEPDALKAFNTAGYRFDAKASDDTVWVFSRKSK